MNQLGKFNGVLLVSDFDDTLYGEDMRITRENVEALTYFTPVSYTHLDVYKRQGRSWSASATR